ncbi:MAG TPA: cupin domain-containing protein [Pyrinomonadaceae bacterium]|jgi:oxalate decarboxylase/phosphoglucose isomerase-like protein (cupin superfamily)|nr:cupin domain-containing protein [Pyrinomonadaceae bacterium]
MTSRTDGTGANTTQTQICHQRKYLEGTYKYGPHEKSVMHRHPNSVAIFVTDSNATFTFPKSDPQNIVSKAGETRFIPGGLHLPENTGDQPFEVILVELKSSRVKKTA